MVLGTFGIYFDEDAAFDQTCVAEILKDALEDSMRHILKLLGLLLPCHFSILVLTIGI